MGFSEENLVTAFMIFARVSGGRILSSHSMPLFPKPVTVPWMEPVKPPSASAMIMDEETLRTYLKRKRRLGVYEEQYSDAPVMEDRCQTV